MFSIPIISPLFRTVMRIVSIIVWLLTVAAAFGGRIDPTFFTIPALLTLALPYLAILSGLLIIFWALSQRIVFTILGIIAIAVSLQPLSQAFPLHTARSPRPGQQTFKIIAWNVLHTQDISQPESPRNRAVEYMINSGADIICLAELTSFSPSEIINAPQPMLDSLFAIYPYHAGETSSDIKILSKYPVQSNNHSGFSGRGFEFFKVKMPAHELNVAMVHLTSYELTEEERKVVTDARSINGAKESVKELKTTIYHKMRNAFQQRAESAKLLRDAIERTPGPLIVCGDFNDVPASWTYNIVVADDMRDAYAETNFGPTWTYNQHLFLFHIDQMLYRGPLEALSLNVGKIKTSDHYPLIGTFAFLNVNNSEK